MTKPMAQVLYWAPRVLGLLFALFVSVFSLDVSGFAFGQAYGFWNTIVTLVLHLTRVYLLVIAVAIGWRWDWMGTILFFGISLWFLIEAWAFRATTLNVAGILSITVPPVVIGLLFLVSWFIQKGPQVPM